MGVNPQLNLQMWGEKHVTTRTSDDIRVLGHSRILGKLDHQTQTAWNTLSLRDYIVQVTLPYAGRSSRTV